MTVQARHGGRRRRRIPSRYGIAALAIGVGIAAAPGVAWADPGRSDSGTHSAGQAASTDTGTASHDDAEKSSDRHRAHRRAPAWADHGTGSKTDVANGTKTGTVHDARTATKKTNRTDTTPDSPNSGAVTPGTADAEAVTPDPPDSTIPRTERAAAANGRAVVTDRTRARAHAPSDPTLTPAAPPSDLVAAQDDSAPDVRSRTRAGYSGQAPKPGARWSHVDRVSALDADPSETLPETTPADPALELDTPAALNARVRTHATAAVTSTTVEVTTPSTPQPLSPIAKILQLPGRIINAVLKVLGVTTSANSPKSLIDFSPIADTLFAVFRDVERLFGMYKQPAAQPVVPTLTYTGPTTAPTPTVAQFLNAASAAYVLGGTPGGLKPFTVNGFQMESANVFSGAAAKVWVTPEQQIIIAYQGTTGGTNLLSNPLIAISQLIADLQVVFTDTTPQAFTDSLTFARQVQAEAADAGYDADDIFVTGHSLGGWEAEYVAQQTGMAGIGFESPGINTVVPGNGVDSMFVNIETYGDLAAYFSTDLPGLQPFMPAYVPGGGSKPHYGSIVMIGDPSAVTPLLNASALWGTSLFGDIIFAGTILGEFFAHHLPAMQAYNLDVPVDPGVVPWLGSVSGPVNTGYGELTIQQLLQEASDAGMLIRA